MAISINIVKSPSVIISKGRDRVFKSGFRKQFNNPKTIPKTKRICHWVVKEKSKKFDVGYVLITTP